MFSRQQSPTSRQRLLNTLLASVFSLVLVMPGLASAGSIRDTRPTGLAMVGDALIARPLLAASAVAGSAFFVVTLPLSLLGGNAGEVGHAMVVVPARSAFLRCMGCTPVQDERNRIRINQQRMAAEAKKEN